MTPSSPTAQPSVASTKWTACKGASSKWRRSAAVAVEASPRASRVASKRRMGLSSIPAKDLAGREGDTVGGGKKQARVGTSLDTQAGRLVADVGKLRQPWRIQNVGRSG